MILHVDMDAFFASVEVLDNPGLAGKCVIVGGMSNRGVVSAASYEARKYGVHSAMPMYQARQRCPHGVFRPPRRQRYKALSHMVMTILARFSPLVEPVSIDEAYVDITGCDTLHGTPEAIGLAIKESIRDETGLTCTVGAAPLKFLAKIASDMDKPDGLTVISPAAVPEFIHHLPIDKVPGVGRHTREHLERLGISTLGDVGKYSIEQLTRRFGKTGKRLADLAAGIDDSEVRTIRPVKSVSSEETLPADTRDMAFLRRYLLKQAEDVGRQLRKQELLARTVTLKLKHADFTQVTRQMGLARQTRSSETLFKAACRLLAAYKITQPVRLIGMGASDLSDKAAPVQMTLFDDPAPEDLKWEALGRTVDAVIRRFGRDMVKKAELFDKPQKPK
ncbi:MAG: DNA polymerase IV [Desulfobacterales bacterium]